MASVIIREKDYTESAAYEPTDTIVYIPGMPGDDCLDVAPLVNKPLLYTNVEDFNNAVGSKPKILESYTNSEGELVVTQCDKSYVIAKQMLGLGMKVLYEVVSTTDDITVAADTRDALMNRLSDATH